MISVSVTGDKDDDVYIFALIVVVVPHNCDAESVSLPFEHVSNDASV